MYRGNSALVFVCDWSIAENCATAIFELQFVVYPVTVVGRNAAGGAITCGGSRGGGGGNIWGGGGGGGDIWGGGGIGFTKELVQLVVADRKYSSSVSALSYKCQC